MSSPEQPSAPQPLPPSPAGDVTADDGAAGSAVPPAQPGAPAGARAGTRLGAALRGARGVLALGGRNLSRNLASALGLLVLLRRDSGAWRTGGGSLLLLFALRLCIGLGYDLYAFGWREGHLDIYALPGLSFWALALLLGAALLVGLAGRWQRRSPTGAAVLVLTLATAGFALACCESLAATALALAADRWSAVDRVYPLLSWLPLLWVALAYAVAAARLAGAAPAQGPEGEPQAPGAAPAPHSGGASAARRLLLFAVAAALVVTPQWAVDPAARLWTTDVAEDGAAAGPDAPQAEQTLYGQFDLLNDALDAIVPGQQGVTELFTISFAGDGTQDVFLNEAAGADAVMADVFDSGEHSLVLANSVARPQERPFATVSALERSLAEVADRMNVDEDVLAIVLTSHGTPDHHLSVVLPPYQFDDLTPERLRGMLDEAGIRFRVIIVSSCYAGGFLEPLAGPDTMVITASGADRTSFGCRDGEQWTDFGRAYFAEALAQAASFEGAFRIARGRIAEREAREGLAPSEPQIFVGPGIREQLQRLETRRGGRILFAAHGPLRQKHPIHRTESRQG
jgi:hypothetical protein